MATVNILFDKAIAGIDQSWLDFMTRTGLLADAKRILADIAATQANGPNREVPIESIICPRSPDIFAFARFPLGMTRVVIFGQDPYQYQHRATGFAFSVPKDVAPPPSLKNILHALCAQKIIPESSMKCGDLTNWCRQGVLLLNAALTTVVGISGQHVAQWAPFTRKMIGELCKEVPGLIFVLLGTHAHKYTRDIAQSCNFLKWGHPSPMNEVNRDESNPQNFVHCTVFREVNNIMAARDELPINWDPAAQESALGCASASAAPGAPPVSRKTEGHVERIYLEGDDPLVNADEEGIIAFVDGAAKANGKVGASAGYAVIIVAASLDKYEIIGRIPSGTVPTPTNNRAELSALRDLFIFVSSEEFIAQYEKAPLTVVYDSAYAAGCVREWYESWTKSPPREVKQNLDIISVAYDHYTRVSAIRRVEWIKVSSHLKEPARSRETEWYHWYGNSLVDELAQKACP